MAFDALGFDSEAEYCPGCHAPATSIGLFCDKCGSLLIQYSKAGLATFVAATLAAVVLFRISDTLWPVYLLVASCIIHLYAVIFTRGSALVSAAFVTLAVSLFWGLWQAATWLTQQFPGQPFVSGQLGPFQTAVQPYVAIAPLAAWCAGIIWAIVLGRRRATAQLRLASSYFLGTGAFIFGLWGVWAVLIQSRLFRLWIFQLAVVLALIVPLILLFVALKQPLSSTSQGQAAPPTAPALDAAPAEADQQPEPTEADTFGQVAALWFLFLTAYLFSTQALTSVVQYGLGHFLPRLLGQEVDTAEYSYGYIAGWTSDRKERQTIMTAASKVARDIVAALASESADEAIDLAMSSP